MVAACIPVATPLATAAPAPAACFVLAILFVLFGGGDAGGGGRGGWLQCFVSLAAVWGGLVLDW